MKQQITLEEFNQLPEKERDKLSTWMVNRRYPKEMTIGQMIEFLGDNINIYYRIKEITSWVININKNTYFKEELCDALWEAVKEVLKNNED